MAPAYEDVLKQWAQDQIGDEGTVYAVTFVFNEGWAHSSYTWDAAEFVVKIAYEKAAPDGNPRAPVRAWRAAEVNSTDGFHALVRSLLETSHRMDG